MRMRGRQLGGVLYADDALIGVDRAQRGGQQRGLSGARAAGNQEGQPGRDDVVEQLGGLRRDGPRPGQRGQVLVAGRGTQRRACPPPRWAAAPRAAGQRTGPVHAGQRAVDPGLRLVEAPPSPQRQSLCEPVHGGVVGETDGAAAQAVSVVHHTASRP